MAYEELIARLEYHSKSVWVESRTNTLLLESAAALREQAREIEKLRNDLDFCSEDLHEKYKADLQREGDHYRELLAQAEIENGKLRKDGH